MEVPVYYLFHGDFVDFDFFASRCQIHVVEEGPEEGSFDHTEAPTYERAVVQTINGTEAKNQIDGSNKEDNLPVLKPQKIESNGRGYGHYSFHWNHN